MRWIQCEHPRARLVHIVTHARGIVHQYTFDTLNIFHRLLSAIQKLLRHQSLRLVLRIYNRRHAARQTYLVDTGILAEFDLLHFELRVPIEVELLIFSVFIIEL